METIVSLLVLGAIYLVSYVMKSLSASPGEEGGKSIFGEGFPTIEVLEPEQEYEHEQEPLPVPEPKPEPMFEPQPRIEVPRPTVVPKAYSAPTPRAEYVPAIERTTTVLSQTSVPAQAMETEKPARRERLVALNSKSEAKRAFIYSEIFNRKY